MGRMLRELKKISLITLSAKENNMVFVPVCVALDGIVMYTFFIT